MSFFSVLTGVVFSVQAGDAGLEQQVALWLAVQCPGCFPSVPVHTRATAVGASQVQRWELPAHCTAKPLAADTQPSVDKE